MNDDNEKKILTSTYSFELTTKTSIKLNGEELRKWFNQGGKEYSILESQHYQFLSSFSPDLSTRTFRVEFSFIYDIREDWGKMNYTTEIIKALLQFQRDFKCELEGYFDWYYKPDFFSDEIDINYDNGRYVAPDFKRIDLPK
jgi:hypothetical protein|tara:strand:- start:37 stop:462 length:426 start_codon:yes stop_codon:yes gene_type:complete